MPINIWERYLRATLVSRDGVFIIPSTSSDNSELMDKLYDEGQNKRNKYVESWEFPAFTNPYWAQNIEREKERLKHELCKEAYEEQVLGKKVHYTGRYFKEYDHELHTGMLELNPLKPEYRSWDFGYRHPCIGWFQVINGRVHWLNTYLGTDLDDKSVVELGLYLSGKTKPINILIKKTPIAKYINFLASLNLSTAHSFCSFIDDFLISFFVILNS